MAQPDDCASPSVMGKKENFNSSTGSRFFFKKIYFSFFKLRDQVPPWKRKELNMLNNMR